MAISALLHNGTIVDGTGGAPYVTDVAIVNDRIAFVGNCGDREAREQIDCTGKIVAPGFIDVHSHSDHLWLVLPRCDGKIAQGVTTEIAGNCGSSAAPLYSEQQRERVSSQARRAGLDVSWRSLDDFLSLVERSRTALNVATLAGLGTTRSAVAGDSERPLDDDELASEAKIVREACEQGALGVSSGLIYPPSSYAGVRELSAMASAAREGGAPLYASHVRSESDELEAAIEEALEVGRRAHVAVQCSHHKASGKKNWGKVHGTLHMIDRARLEGIAATCDVYPYRASWTELAVVLPADVRYGGVDATIERLRDPDSARAIALALNLRPADEWHDIMITDVRSNKNAELAGRRIDDIAAQRGVTPARAVIELLLEEHLDVGAVFFTMCEDDVATVLSADFCCIGSDASIRGLAGPTAHGLPHPRTFGTFPRVYRRFVRERPTLTMADAVRRMTSLPASIFGLRDRGTIAQGKYADLAIFDQKNVRDTATYEQPSSLPEGIEHVFVNGRAVLRGGKFTNELPGRVLRNGGR